MAGKYYVWGEGVWREVDVASGRVSGWRRRARFVFVRRGRLLVARRRPVLRALEALAAGQPSAAADGPRLSHRSKSGSRTKRKQETPAPPPAPAAPPAAPPACEHHHCCAHRCNNNDTRPAGTRNIATQCGAGPPALACDQKHAATVTAAAAPDYSSAEEFVSPSARRPVLAACRPSLAARRKTEVNELFGKTPAIKPPAAADKKRAPVATHAADTSDDESRERARKRPRTVVSDSSSTNEPLQRGHSPGACKELIISEADVALLRGFVSRTRPSALARFDADVTYQRLLFHAINPLVHVERCARLERQLRTKRTGPTPARPVPALARPVPALARPGPVTARPRARPAPRRQRSASADTDKENMDEHSSTNKVRESVSGTQESPEKRPASSLAPPSRLGVSEKKPASSLAPPSRLGVSERNNTLEKEAAVIKAPKTNGVAGDPPRAKPAQKAVVAHAGASAAAGRDGARSPPGAHVISKRASIAKEYSNLEDHAIVAWVSSGSRASLVSGNRLWRDLQEQYERLTGRARSWHSLRNRYLRYILPSLGALQLPPADVSRLRAAAATGAIKTKNRLAVRRHSAYQTPPRGAASRRARPGDDAAAAAEADATGPSSPKRRSLRSRPPESASKDTSNKDESGNESASKASGKKELHGQAAGSKASGRMELHSQAAGNKGSGSKAGGSKEHDSQAPGSRAGGSKEVRRAARSPRYSEVTRRFAARRRAAPSSSSPSPSPSPSSAPASSRSPSPVLQPSTRSRRLFNPNTNV